MTVIVVGGGGWQVLCDTGQDLCLYIAIIVMAEGAHCTGADDIREHTDTGGPGYRFVLLYFQAHDSTRNSSRSSYVRRGNLL